VEKLQAKKIFFGFTGSSNRHQMKTTRKQIEGKQQPFPGKPKTAKNDKEEETDKVAD